MGRATNSTAGAMPYTTTSPIMPSIQGTCCSAASTAIRISNADFASGCGLQAATLAGMGEPLPSAFICGSGFHSTVGVIAPWTQGTVRLEYSSVLSLMPVRVCGLACWHVCHWHLTALLATVQYILVAIAQNSIAKMLSYYYLCKKLVYWRCDGDRLEPCRIRYR